MDDQQRFQKNKSTVISIIKYIFYIAIIAGVLFASSKVLVIIMPFLIGFILAKASREISNAILKRRYRNRTRQEPKNPDQSEEAGVKSGKKNFFHSKFWLFLFPPKTKKSMSTRTKLSVVIYVFLLILVTVSLVVSASLLVVQAKNVANSIPGWMQQINSEGFIRARVFEFSEQTGDFLSDEQVNTVATYVESNVKGAQLTDRVGLMVNSALNSLLAMIGNLPMILFYIIVIIMSGFYFLTDSRLVFEFLSRNIKSRSFRHQSILLVDRLSTTLFRVLGGYLLLLIITFAESLIILMIAGVDYAVIFALITAVLDFMPVLGVSATMVPLMIYLALQGNYLAVIVIIIGMAVITVIRRFLEPPILGNAMHMHPMATLFAMIFGVAIWGAIGFLMGPVVLLVLIEAIKGFKLDKKIRATVGAILNKVSEEN
jgi:sporulation integral membrane protein YtvI